MTKLRLSRSSIAARIASLRSRHREVDDQVADAQRKSWSDSTVIKKLKLKKLRLKDEIRRHEGLLLTLSRRRLHG